MTKKRAFELKIQEIEAKYKELYGLPFSDETKDKMTQEVYGEMIEIRETKKDESKE